MVWAAAWAASTLRFLPSSLVKEEVLEVAALGAAVSRAAAVSTHTEEAVAAHEGSPADSAAHQVASTSADKRQRTTATSARQPILTTMDQNQNRDDTAGVTVASIADALTRTRIPRGGALKPRPMQLRARRNWSSFVDLE